MSDYIPSPRCCVQQLVFSETEKKKTGKLRYFSSIFRSMEIQKGTRCFHLAQPASTAVRVRVRPGEVYGSFRGGGGRTFDPVPRTISKWPKDKEMVSSSPPKKNNNNSDNNHVIHRHRTNSTDPESFATLRQTVRKPMVPCKSLVPKRA